VLDPEAPGVGRLREVLSTQGFLHTDLDRVLGVAFGPGHLRSDLPLYERRLASPAPLHTLIKLFGLYVDVPEDDACAAFAPLRLDEVVAMGLVERRDRLVRSRVGLVTTGDLVLARDRLVREGAPLRPDHVIGLNPPAMQLGTITVRRPVRAALDLGCGGGVQALLAASHADRVVAVDVNPRALEFTRFNARVNGIRNVECRQGDFFAPVKGERFGLVVCNPPYAISPDARFVFRDSGRPGDAVCEEVVSRIPDHLEEGGFASVLCNWALRRDEAWSAPPMRWVEGRGCDAWLLGSGTKDPLSYAAGWNRNADRDDYEASTDRWLAYYRKQEIEAIGMGAVVLRRRTAGRNWVRTDQLPADPIGPCHEQILRVFAAEDLLSGLTDADFLEQVLAAGDDHRLYQTLARREGEYRVEAAELRLSGGFGFRGVADGSTLELLRRCNGQRPLRTILSELAELAGIDPETLATAAVATVRRLVAMGFLLPADERAERRTSDGSNAEITTEENAPAEGVPRLGERVGAGSDR
jgi:SAM-dependent methyltransferase